MRGLLIVHQWLFRGFTQVGQQNRKCWVQVAPEQVAEKNSIKVIIWYLIENKALVISII